MKNTFPEKAKRKRSSSDRMAIIPVACLSLRISKGVGVGGAVVRRLLPETLFRLFAQGETAAGELDLCACGRGRHGCSLVFFRFASFAVTSYLAFSHFVLLGRRWIVESETVVRQTGMQSVK